MQLYRYKRGVIIRTETGVGEIAPLPGFSKETLDEALEDLQAKRPSLPSVRFALFCAARPLQSVHLPTASLGPKEGFSTHKLKLGHLSIADAVNFVKAHLGKKLRLDCNRKWTLAMALEFAKQFKPDDFEYLEEPVQTIEELIAFSKMTNFPVAVDESIGCNYEEIPTLKAVVVKPTIVGHIPKIPKHLKMIVSSSYESGIGLLHIASLAQDLPVGLDTVHQDDLLHQPIRCENGFFSWESTPDPINWDKLCVL